MVVFFQIYLPEAISMTQTKATVKSATAAIPTTKIRQNYTFFHLCFGSGVTLNIIFPSVYMITYVHTKTN